MLQKLGPLTRPESFKHGECIAIDLGPRTNLFVSLCGSWIQLQQYDELHRNLFASSVVPVSELSSLIQKLEAAQRLLYDSGRQSPK